MMIIFGFKRWLITSLTICCCLLFSWLTPANAGDTSTAITLASTPNVAKELVNLPQLPLNQFPAVPCTNQLQTQFTQQAKIALSCNIGEMLPAEKVLPLGSFSGLGLTKSNLAQIAGVNNIDLQQIGADQLQSLYSLITPNKLLGDQLNNLAQNKLLGDLPLVKEALIQDITSKIQLGDLTQLQPLNNLLQQANGYADLLNPEKLQQQLTNIALDQVVAALPDFGNFSLGSLSLDTLKNFNVSDAIPGLANQVLGSIPGVESLMVGDLGAVGLSNLSLSQFPNPLSFVAGINFGQLDLPLSNDERDPGRQISGGLPEADYQLRKQKCSGKCKFAEIASPNPAYHGAAWMDGGEHWVPDGFGFVCLVPGACKGPAGNHPFGKTLRLLLTNIDASAGTAQLSFTFPICWEFISTCTPAIFPIPSGLPLYTVHEGDWLPFVAPVNYGNQNANWSPPHSPDKPIARSIG
jgi:hypothetical protein